MKRKIRKILCGLAAVILALTMWSGSGDNVYAEEGYQEKNPYVLNFGGHSGDIHVYAQFSPFVPILTYDGEEVPGYSIIFGLYNEYEGKAFESLYCTDMPVDAIDNTNYRRINLSDSTYAGKLANQLRGILLNTYPYISVDKLAEKSGIDGLTRGEAITGSQIAIWKTAHGDNVEVKNFLNNVTYGNSGSSDIQKELHKELEAYSGGSTEYKKEVKQHIEKLYDYLMDLKPVAAKKTVISESAFLSKEKEVKEHEDGTCTITVTTKISAQVDASDELKVTAYLTDGKHHTSTTVKNGVHEYTLTLEHVPKELADEVVMLAIDGTQNAGDDVYLIDAEGIRGTSQSMIGVMGGTLPVHAETKVEPDRKLQIIKTDGSGTALENISFNVYYVCSLEEYLNGTVAINKAPTQADVEKYAITKNLVGTITTDESGKGTLNLGTSDGIYLVKELPNEAVTGTITPFFVSLPDYSRCDKDGNPSYVITAEPKNTTVTEEVDIEKDVTELNNKSDTYDVGEEHTWIIRTTLPKSLSSGKLYEITDTLDYRLTYQQIEKVCVAQKGENDDELELKADKDYTVSTETVKDENDRVVDKVTISLTKSGMKKVAAHAEGNFGIYEVRTYLISTINENAQMGTNIENQAHILFQNNIGKKFKDDSDKPEIHTGGVNIWKVDKSDKEKVLSGAEFQVYRKATEEEVAEDTENKLPTLKVGDTTYKAVLVSFYDNPELTGEKVTSFTSGKDGRGYVYGLAYGTYYLVETKAPDGYHKLKEPIEITIDQSSHLKDSKVIVQNSSGFELPSTGGFGTRLFTLFGSVLVLVSVSLLIYKKKKENIV